jgi:hypothetical protein
MPGSSPCSVAAAVAVKVEFVRLVRVSVRVPAHAVRHALVFAHGPFAQTTTGRGIASSHGHSEAARRAPADRAVVAPRVVRRQELRVMHHVRRDVSAADRVRPDGGWARDRA